MSKFETDKAALIVKAIKPRLIKVNYREGHYSILPYETTQNTGGVAMGLGQPRICYERGHDFQGLENCSSRH